MILERIDKIRLLIAISEEEMKNFDLTFRQLDWNNYYARGIIKKLLSVAQNETGFDTENQHLLIEAMQQNNGCIILITLLSVSKKRRKLYKIKSHTDPVIFEFETAEDLLRAAERVYKAYFHIVYSQVLKCSNKYYMIICNNTSQNKKIQSIVSEYGILVGIGFIESARWREQGEVLIQANAIDVLGRTLACRSRT